MIDVPRPRSGRLLSPRPIALTLAALLVPLGTPATAMQAVVQPLGTPANADADRLADLVRRLGSSPRDLSALIEAGELSFTLGDATAAAAFYKRAEAIDPDNGRVKAGIARILVNGERPGEALRYFEQAQRYGATMARYADDRGLAYDLIGEQARAQADYRLALAQGGRDAAELDEVRRRYALSLGISGKRDEALAQIDGLLRRQDRGAWRAQAFILAMNGDVAGANKIATGMMPRGMASGLAAFFQRLPQLSPTDRAFAVHFGEVTPTPARLADARMAPVLPGSAPRVEVASAPTVQPLPTPTRAESRRRERTQVARNTVAPRPAIATPSPATAVVQPLPPEPTPTLAPAQVAQAVATPPVATTPTPQPVTPTPAVQVAAATPRPRAVTPPLRVKPPRLSEDSILARIVAGISVPATELDVAPMPGAQRVPVVAPPAPSAASLEEAARAAERNAAADEQKRSRLAAAKRVAEKAAPVEEKVAEAETKPVAGRRTRGKAVAEETTEAKPLDRKAKAKELAAEKAEAKPLDRKAKAKELAADKAKKEAAAKEAAEKKAARAEPARFWVQVASGANVDDMPKAWKGVQGKAKALGGQRAYTVKNRATNRLVTGPYKTEAEARAMVNTLNKQGLSAFSFTSETGQKMTPLGKK